LLDEKEALIDPQEKRELIIQGISTIVDADDKNCLVQLTVVQKFNQGVRQWLYIIAGVLFFGPFFCTSKRKNRK
jgi:hypothetical protein